jgi:hypothetical protein
MAISNDDLLTLLPGRKVLVTDCEAAEHGDNNGCLCSLKGKVVILGKQRQSVFVGTPTWHIEGSSKRTRLSEVTLVCEADPQN